MKRIKKSMLWFGKRLFLTLLLIIPVGIAAFLGYSDIGNSPDMKRPYTSWFTDPSNEIIISWEFDTPDSGYVLYGNHEDNLNLSKIDSSITNIHHINLTGLDPNQKYYYKVYNSIDSFFGAGTFYTAPANQELSFSWGMFSDTQQPVITGGHHYRVAKEIDKQDLRFVANVGDHVDKGSDKSEFNNFFEQASPYLDHVSFLPVIGNHDYRGANESFFFQYFINQRHTTNGSLFFYSFNYSMVHFSMCNIYNGWPSQLSSEQLNWLENDLKNSQSLPFRVIMFHCPINGSAFFGVNTNLNKILVPILFKYNVSLIVNGHEHHYERGYYPNPQANASQPSQIMYLILGGGGGPGDIGVRPLPTAEVVTTGPGFSTINATKTALHLQTWTAEGELIDSSQIKATN
jgi:Calcineurin-like phosphoesterase/Purple acid Phosphatase, N-terminal domain